MRNCLQTARNGCKELKWTLLSDIQHHQDSQRRLLTVPYFLASTQDRAFTGAGGHLGFTCTKGLGGGFYSGGGREARKLLSNRTRPLSRFETSKMAARNAEFRQGTVNNLYSTNPLP